MGERARGGWWGGCTESSPSQWGPAWGRLCSRPQPSTVAPLPAQHEGPLTITRTQGARGAEGGRTQGFQPEDTGHSQPRGCPQQQCQDAGGGSSQRPNKRGLCVAGSRRAGEPGQVPLFHLRAHKPAAARGNRGGTASSRVSRGAPWCGWGTWAPSIRLGPQSRSAAHALSAVTVKPR